MGTVGPGRGSLTGVAARLIAAGMSQRESVAKGQLFDRGDAALERSRSSSERVAFFVPGRIEVLGKHTDYAGGRSLLCTVERGFIVMVAPRGDNAVHVTDAVRDETHTFALDAALEIPQGDWGSYVAASIRRLARNFPDARCGADITFASDLPPASGMSSSSALSTSIFFAVDAVNDIQASDTYSTAIHTLEELAGYLGTIENGQGFGPLAGDSGVGTFGGSEDHTAILCCRSDFVSRFSFTPVRPEMEIRCPDSLTFVVAFSGVAAEKGFGAQQRYNELSLGVRQILALWNSASAREDDSLACAVESAADAPARIRSVIQHAPAGEFTAARLLERFDQFVTESAELIPGASNAFLHGDLAAFGGFVDRSQQGAEKLLRNQIPETILLARAARGAGAHAASAFGAGFGGSVWALVDTVVADDFVRSWSAEYQAAFPEAARHAEFFLSRPGPGALRI